MGHHLRCQPWPERPSTIGESRDSNNPQDNRNGSPAPAREPIVQEHSTQTVQAVKETDRQQTQVEHNEDSRSQTDPHILKRELTKPKSVGHNNVDGQTQKQQYSGDTL